HDAEPSPKTRSPGCRQDMVGPGSVIACRLRRVITDEYRPGILHQGQSALLNRYVFGCDTVCPVKGLLSGCGYQCRPTRSDRASCDRVLVQRRTPTSALAHAVGN